MLPMTAVQAAPVKYNIRNGLLHQPVIFQKQPSEPFNYPERLLSQSEWDNGVHNL